jgi:hypothetical protein
MEQCLICNQLYLITDIGGYMAGTGSIRTVFLVLVLLTLPAISMTISDNAGSESALEITKENKGIDDVDGYFTENRGQWKPEFSFIGSAPFGHVGLGPSSVFLNLVEVTSVNEDEPSVEFDGYVLKYNFEGANEVLPVGEGLQFHQSNFILGDDPAGWTSGVGNYEAILYENLWDNIDLRYLISNGDPKYEFVLQPGADPSAIIIRTEGHASLHVAGEDLEIRLKNGRTVKDSGLSVFYEDDGTQVHSGFTIIDENTFSFDIENYDRSRSIVIDPLIYSTLISGTDWEHGRGIAYDSSGNAYVTGQTLSTDFPTTTGAYDETQNGLQDAYVSKLNPSGSAMVYTTYIGGSMDEWGYGLDVDSSGCAYATGITKSSNFPTTTGAYDETYSVDWDAFIYKLNASGTGLVYSTFIGSSGRDVAHRLELDSNDNPVITGRTESTNFPTTSGAYDEVHNGAEDVFVLKLNASGDSVLSSTFIGSVLDERGNDLDLDSNDNVYVTGFSVYTVAGGFPTTTGAYDETQNGGEDVILFKLNASFSDLLYSTFAGGSGDDRGRGIEVDTNGYIYAAGRTKSTDFPMSSGAYDNSYKGTEMAFAIKLDADGSSLKYSTYLGGNGNDKGEDLAIDAGGFAYVVGSTSSTTYPVTGDGENQTHSGGILDLFLTKVAADGKSLVYSTFRGGSGQDYGYAVRLDSKGAVYLAGTSSSSNFPITPGAAQTSRKGSDEAVCVKFTFAPPFPSPSNLQAVMGKGYVQLNWDAAVGGTGLQGYKVFRGPGMGSETLLTTLGDVTAFNDTTIENGRVYYYYVTAFNVTSESYASNEVMAADIVKPVFGLDGTPLTATTGDPLMFSVSISDNIEVNSAFVEYRYGTGVPVNISMSNTGGSQWTFQINVNHTLEDLHYDIKANDTTDNWNGLSGTVTITDNDKAQFGLDTSSPLATTGDEFIFGINITDNIAVADVWVEYRYGTGTPVNMSMTKETGVSWMLSIYNPENATDTLHYTFHANDTSDNWADSPENSINVLDNDLPELVLDLTATEAPAGEKFEFGVEVSDNIDIGNARSASACLTISHCHMPQVMNGTNRSQCQMYWTP